jgi:hypothetical protein
LAIDTFSGSEGIVRAAVALIPKHHELSGREGALPGDAVMADRKPFAALRKRTRPQ